MATRVRIDLFDRRVGHARGRSVAVEALWYAVKCAFFLSCVPWPSRLKCALLRIFGARIGTAVSLKPRVNITFPWKLSVGDYTCIGEEVFILNFEPITIGRHCCISQRAFLCTGNHDYRAPQMPYRNQPITIRDGVWVGAQAFVAPGVELGSDCVVTAGSVVARSLPSATVCSGNPCSPVRSRWKD
jgi:putative colanic acid biosynthesis acetyltransferase WcaF